MLNDRGGFESTALRLSDEAYRLYVGTAAIKRDLVWLRNHLEAKERVRLFDETEGCRAGANGTSSEQHRALLAPIGSLRSAILVMPRT